MLSDPNILGEVVGLWPLAAGVVTGLSGLAIYRNHEKIESLIDRIAIKPIRSIVTKPVETTL